MSFVSMKLRKCSSCIVFWLYNLNFHSPYELD